MNLPNKLTVLRVCLIPVFLILYLVPSIPGNYLWALLVFAAASITDLLDGKIARKHGLVTDFGKLMDPLADKLLVTGALICLLQGSVFNIVCLIIVISRDLIVTSIRLLAAGNGIVIAADKVGKIKTAVQMVWICLMLLQQSFAFNFAMPPELVMWMGHLVLALFGAMMALTVISGAHYIIQNRHLFADA